MERSCNALKGSVVLGFLAALLAVTGCTSSDNESADAGSNDTDGNDTDSEDTHSEDTDSDDSDSDDSDSDDSDSDDSDSDEADKCPTGQTLCGNRCIDTKVDSTHCGACNKTCAAGEVCSAGECSLTCQNSLVNCDGTCIDPLSNNAYCGASGNCQAGDAGENCSAANGLAFCNAGNCEVACYASFGDCDDDYGSGCETNLMNDDADCGFCGNACDTEDMCDDGVCAPISCSGNAVIESIAPSGMAVVCDDPSDLTCEENMETLCPAGWGLCSPLQLQNRNTGWTYAVNSGNVVVGEIYCRNSTGAGHYSLGGLSSGNLETDFALNCHHGSSRPACTSEYGCNEKGDKALCCRPLDSCGNGEVDTLEEECDDGDTDESNDCLNSCSWRIPTAHGLSGTNC